MTAPWDARTRTQWGFRFWFLERLLVVARKQTWDRLVETVVPNIPSIDVPEEELAAMPGWDRTTGPLGLMVLQGGWEGLAQLQQGGVVLRSAVEQWQRETNLSAGWCALAAIATAERVLRTGEASEPEVGFILPTLLNVDVFEHAPVRVELPFFIPSMTLSRQAQS